MFLHGHTSHGTHTAPDANILRLAKVFIGEILFEVRNIDFWRSRSDFFFFFSNEGQKGRDEKVRVIGLSPHNWFESRASGEMNEEDACLEQALTLT